MHAIRKELDVSTQLSATVKSKYYHDTEWNSYPLRRSPPTARLM